MCIARAFAPFGAIALAVALAACEAPAPPAAPLSGLLITLDTTRADALGSYGALPGLTPFLDELAREGIVYEQARAVAPITLPSHASMLTGLYPPRHGTRDNGWSPLSPEALTLAERARAAGLATGAFVSAVVLDETYGLDQGFHVYASPERRSGGTDAAVDALPGHEVSARASAWVRDLDPAAGFFLWLHLFDPHFPLSPPADLLRRARGDPYLGEVAAADAAVGELLATLEALGRLDTTFVAVVGDHGEGRGDHGESSHGVFCYDSTLRVPFLLRHPDGRRAGQRSREIVSVVDVYPTFLEALDLGDPGPVDGVSLLGDGIPAQRGIYFESFYGHLQFGWAPLVGWASAGHKLVLGAAAEHYDVGSDPGELRELPLTDQELAVYRAAIAGVLEAPALPVQGSVTAEAARRLEQLGYAASGDGASATLVDPLSDHGLPDPRARRIDASAFDRALTAASRGDLETAIRVLGEILERDPDSPSALHYRAAALASTGRCEEALGLLSHLESVAPPRGAALANHGTCLLRLGRPREAIPHFERALARDPGSAAARLGLASARKAVNASP